MYFNPAVYLKTLFLLFINSLCKIFLEIFVFDKQIRKILKGKLAKQFIKKYVKRASKLKTKDDNTDNNTPVIWQYWEQGIENAPDIVKACINSVEKHKNGCEHKILDFDSLKNYIEIPNFIYKLREKGKIPKANFSDIVRIYLLAKYGGIWADSTIFFSQNLPEYIINSSLFVLKSDPNYDIDGLNTTSYFIAGKKNSAYIQQMKYFVDEYWKNNYASYNYFFFLHAMSLLIKYSKEAKEEYDKVPFMSFIPVQRFQEELSNEFSKERMEQIKSMSPFHKLTYKTDLIYKNKKEKSNKETFFDKLVKNEL